MAPVTMGRITVPFVIIKTRMTFNEVKAKLQIMLEDDSDDEEFRNQMLEVVAIRLIRKFKLRPTVKVSDEVN